jgi:hypothetical protein
MQIDAIQHITNPTPSDSVIQVSAVPDLSDVIVLRGNRLKCSVEDRHKYESTVQKNHQEILTAE